MWKNMQLVPQCGELLALLLFLFMLKEHFFLELLYDEWQTDDDLEW